MNPNKGSTKGGKGKGNGRQARGGKGGKGKGIGNGKGGQSSSYYSTPQQQSQYATVAEKRKAKNKRKRASLQSLKDDNEEMKTVINQVPAMIAEDVAAAHTSGGARSASQSGLSTAQPTATLGAGASDSPMTTVTTTGARQALQRMQRRLSNQ